MTKTHIGELDQRILIQSLARGGDDGQGGYLPGTWADVEEVWAKIEAGSGREVVSSDQTIHRVSHLLTIRRRNDITAAMKVLWVVDGVTHEFAIVGVPPRKKSDMWTTLQCEEGMPS